MASKTRDRLIEVARQLFLRKGPENTTISDIAAASDKGRRTIYTYFRNKKEIYNAVVEQESSRLVSTLVDEVNRSADPAERLRLFIEAGVNHGLDINNSYPWLRNLLSFDLRRFERVRAMVYSKERALLDDIVDAGITSGIFDPQKALLLPDFLIRVVDGMSQSVVGDAGSEVAAGRFADFVIDSIRLK